MEFDPQFCLDTMLPLAEASYDLKKVPKEWNVFATIQPANFGFIADTPLATVISFRGTQTDEEWVEDFDAIPVASNFGPGLVHQGFQLQYLKLRESIQSALRWAAGEIWITGHSLGAALAQLCAADFSDRKLWVYTFEGPRVGLVEWADWFDDNIPNCWRVVNEWDIVPQLPPFLNGYKHAGHAELIDAGPTDDPHVAHSLASCRIGLEKLIAAQVVPAATTKTTKGKSK